MKTLPLSLCNHFIKEEENWMKIEIDFGFQLLPIVAAEAGLYSPRSNNILQVQKTVWFHTMKKHEFMLKKVETEKTNEIHF